MGIHQALWIGGGATESIITQPPLASLITLNNATYSINTALFDSESYSSVEPGFFSITLETTGKYLLSYPGVGNRFTWWTGAPSQIANLWVRFVAISGIPPVTRTSFAAQTFNVWYRMNGSRGMFLNGVYGTSPYTAVFRIDFAESSGGSVIKSVTLTLNFDPTNTTEYNPNIV